MTDVTAAEFEKSVMERSKAVPVVVDFWAPWCGPCRTLGPVLERLEAEGMGKWKLVKVNTEDNQALASRYQIQSIPAVKAFVNGKVVAEFVGALSEAKVRSWLLGLQPPASAADVGRADFAAGAPSLAEARKAIEQGGSGTAVRWNLGRALFAQGDSAEALEILLGIVKTDRAFAAAPFGADAARKAMQAVLDVLGARHPLADEYRRRLAKELARAG